MRINIPSRCLIFFKNYFKNAQKYYQITKDDKKKIFYLLKYNVYIKKYYFNINIVHILISKKIFF